MRIIDHRLINRQALVLGLFAISIGALLWVFNWLTAPQIRINQQVMLENSLNEVLPKHHYDNDLAKTKTVVFDSTTQQSKTVYAAYRGKTPAAAVIRTSTPDGYAGEINLLVAITTDGSITGVRVLKHQETPGLGDDIELRKSGWILDFNGKSVETPLNWAVKRDGGSFDQFTGATITPRAVVGAVRQALSFFEIHQSDIFRTTHD